MNNRVSRRSFLEFSTSAAAIGVGVPLLLAGQNEPAARAAEHPAAFRFVHLTDIHVKPELRADEGLAKCLTAVMRLDPQPDFILTGGDLVWDVYDAQDLQRAKLLFTLLGKVFADHAGVPVHHCIGNHDVFLDGTKPGPEYGKRMATEYLKLENHYYRFDHKGWRFYVLDDMQAAADGSYRAYIDDVQMAWLEAELHAKPQEMPAITVCHMPILTVTAFEDAKQGGYSVPALSMCRDAYQLAKLFARYNVRLALSGHLHQVDKVEYRGVTFICDGAVCGGWWKGPNEGFGPGFGVLDLKADGSVDHRYFEYGWKAATDQSRHQMQRAVNLA